MKLLKVVPKTDALKQNSQETNMLDIPCVIFAGGKSSRMGEDKALLPFAGFNTLTEFQYSRLTNIFKNVYISCKESSKFTFKANFIEDAKTIGIFAPTSGFIAAFEYIHTDKIFVISVDSPFIDKDIIQTLINSDKKSADATIALTQEGIQPLCGIYHRSLYKEFLKMQKENNHKLGFLLKNAHTNYACFTDTRAFLNLNHPHDYQKALTLHQSALLS